MSDPEILALPACREMAEGMAQELRDVAYNDVRDVRCLSDLFADLLSDLDRPASCDAWVRRCILEETAHNGMPHSSPLVRICQYWYDLRDKPAALLAAIQEVSHA